MIPNIAVVYIFPAQILIWSGNKLRTYDNIRKIATGQGDDYNSGCLLDYPNFKKYYKLIAIDLSKQVLIQKQYNKLILLEI